VDVAKKGTLTRSHLINSVVILIPEARKKNLAGTLDVACEIPRSARDDMLCIDFIGVFAGGYETPRGPAALQ